MALMMAMFWHHTLPVEMPSGLFSVSNCVISPLRKRMSWLPLEPKSFVRNSKIVKKATRRSPRNDYKPVLSQGPASWSCMSNTRKYRYDWIITTDLDKYIWVPKSRNETTILAFPLQSYLMKFDPRENSCLIMKPIPFGRNLWIEEPDSPSHRFLIDYVWRRNLLLS